jgi:hypothetical protein
MWHADPLTGNDSKRSNCKVMTPQASVFPQQVENAAILEEKFSTWSVPSCFNQNKLAAAVTYMGTR